MSGMGYSDRLSWMEPIANLAGACPSVSGGLMARASLFG